jgi:glycosyltransferase involved in cell wall biosynthesis
MRRHNILFTSLSGRTVGGGQISLFLLLERLNKKKFMPYLICPSDGDFLERVNKLGIETSVIDMGSIKKPNFISTALTIRRLKKFIGQKKIDLIHSDSPRQAFYAGLAARRTGKPLIWHVRVGDVQNKFYDKLLFSLAARVIAVSDAAKKRLARLVSKTDKLAVIYNGVDLDEFGPHLSGRGVREEFRLKDDCLLVGTAGQLIPSKGQDIFLRAAAQVLKKFSKAKFMVVGTGSEAYRKSLNDLSRDLRIRDNVIFTGFRKDIPQIMSSFDIVVLSTYHSEGLSRVVLEAMASSKPVIATNIGSNPEAIESGRTGTIIPVGDTDRLAESILELAENENKRKAMGEAGRRRAENLFSIERNVEQIERLYEAVLCQDM